jgi:long-chain fatty acid transport protein
MLGAAAAVAFMTSAGANGFRVPPASVAGLGLAHAIVADAGEWGATPYNLSAAAFHAGWIASFGVVGLDTDLRVDNAAGTSTSDVSNPAFIPMGFGEGPLYGDFRWAIAFNAPFGQQTNWPAGAFPGFAGPIAGLAPTRSKIRMLAASPSVTWKPAAGSLALAAGIDYYDVLEARLDSTGSSLHGDGTAVGFQASMLYAPGPWSVGLAYHSSVNVPIDGNLDAFAPNGIVIGGSAHTHLRLPDRAQLGVRWAYRPDMAVEVDAEYTGWGRFRVISIEHDNPAVPVNPLLNTNDWKDTWTWRLGWTYALRPETTLRLGYSYDPSPQPDAHFSPRNPNAASNSFSIGIGHTIGKLRLDAAYMYTKFDDRNFAGATPFNPATLETNGTALVNGNYRSRAQLFGLSATYQL